MALSAIDDPQGRALRLMRQALPLVDAAHESHAAVHLQHAISILEREPVAPMPGRERLIR